MDREMLERLRNSKPSEDGIIATNFNRAVSTQILKCLVKTRITPNQVTFVSFLVAVMAGFLFAAGTYLNLVLGAVLVEVSFTLDCVDGQLARFRNMKSSFGDWFDKVLDRLSEFAIFFGLCFGLYKQSGDVRIWIWGFTALFTVLLLNYAADVLGPLSLRGLSERREKTKTIGTFFLGMRGLIKPGYLSFSRDVQMFLIFLGCISNQVIPLFLALIVLGNAHWVLRAFIYWKSVEKGH